MGHGVAADEGGRARTMKTITTTLILLAAVTASADDWRVSFGIKTTHTAPGDWHEQNELIVVERNHVFGATFVNSFGNRSYAAGGAARYATDHIELELRGGLVQGYNPDELPISCIGGACPFVTWGAAYRIDERVSVGVTQFYNAFVFPVTIRF